MTSLRLKIRAMRMLRGMTQEQAASLAFMNLKTYQRKESGKSPITELDLEKLASAFDCSVGNIRDFSIQHGLTIKRKSSVEELEKENELLISEVLFLRQLLDKVTSASSNNIKEFNK